MRVARFSWPFSLVKEVAILRCGIPGLFLLSPCGHDLETGKAPKRCMPLAQIAPHVLLLLLQRRRKLVPATALVHVIEIWGCRRVEGCVKRSLARIANWRR